MFTTDQKNAWARITLVLGLFVGVFGITPVQAGAPAPGQSNADANLTLDHNAFNSNYPGTGETRTASKLKDETYLNNDHCEPNSGWMWTSGPRVPDAAAQAREKLAQLGIDASVDARSYGETDGCGQYHHHGIDFTVNLLDTASTRGFSQQAIINHVLPVLARLGKPNLGNVHFFSAQGELIPVNTYSEPFAAQTSNPTAPSTDVITKRVYVIDYDPLLSNGQKLSEYMHWNDAATITQQTIDFFSQSSNQRLNYTIVDTAVVTSGWPELVDGFSYTEPAYMAVWANPSLHHEPQGVNYNKIINDPQFDICGKLDRGEIDEVWMYNGPWFGFYESTLVGPGAYYINSGAVGGAHSCDRILPIMGPSVERTAQEAVHNFTHRTEDTMKKVYGSWQENDTSHSWDKFALVKAQSPDYSYSGCGSSHYPPNGTSDYDYGNPSAVLSNCDDFANYPNLGDPLLVSQPVSCSLWGCTGLGYHGYWYSHMPSNAGCGPDNVANDWWKYITDPNIVLYPSYACQADMHFISGHSGTGDATLSYVDGTLKTVASDSYGNYFLLVSNHWSGTVTPSKRGGYIFAPATTDYSDVQSDSYDQDYAAQGTPVPAVLSITRADMDPTDAVQVSFEVNLSESVTGVDMSDFSLTTSGVNGAAVISVSGSGATYTVIVNTGSGDGTIRLDMLADDTVVDASGYPLNLSYTAGETYTITREYSLNIVSANGTVAKNPDQAAYHKGDLVQVTATPASGWIFSGWTGALTSRVNPSFVTILGDTTITANYTPLVTLFFNSVAANDGWILESSEASNIGGSLNTKANTFNIGDDRANQQYLSILDFDTSSLPDSAVITSIKLKIQQQGISGKDPFTTLGDLLVDIQTPYFGMVDRLEIGDFQAAAAQPALVIFDPGALNNWYTIMPNRRGEAPNINLSGLTQFRLRFALDDNNDQKADYMKFYSGDAAAANRPQLIIQYYIGQSTPPPVILQ